MNNLSFFFSGAFLLLFFMILGFFLSKKIKIIALIDIFWSLGPFYIYCYLFSQNLVTREIILLALALLFWSSRLSFFLLWTRILKNHEDPRYQEILSKAKKKKKNIYIFLQFIFQWFLQVCLSISFLPFFWSKNEANQFLLWGGFLLGLISIIGEAKADFELLQFKRKKTGKILNTGLWSLSRHPNYFFDWLFWLAIGLMGASLSYGLFSFTGSVIMWIIFHYLTGPLTERLSLRKHKESYKSYQKRVPFMIPYLFKK